MCTGTSAARATNVVDSWVKSPPDRALPRSPLSHSEPREVTGVRASASLRLSVVRDEPGRFQVGTVGPVVILVLHKKPTAAVVDTFQLGNEQVAKRYGKVAHLILLAERGVAPDADVRMGFARVLRRLAGSIAGEAVVFEARGVGGAMTRSVVRLIHAAGRAYHPHRVMGDLGEACAWLTRDCIRHEGLDESYLAGQARALSKST